jgi:glycerophosphoryl diester phosphodiesterase
MILIGHRGARALEPENTIRALKRGMECADFVEIDVRLSSDGIPVVIHDETVDRTTNGRGPLSDFTVAQLKELDAGAGEKIPTLREVLDLVGSSSGLVVEIKEEGIEKTVCGMLKDSGIEDLFVVSFNDKTVKNVKEILSFARTGLIYSGDLKDPLGIASLIKADAILPKFGRATAELVEEAHRQNFLVFCWTLNTHDEFAGAIEMGVDGFASDNPCEARKYLQKILE